MNSLAIIIFQTISCLYCQSLVPFNYKNDTIDIPLIRPTPFPMGPQSDFNLKLSRTPIAPKANDIKPTAPVNTESALLQKVRELEFTQRRLEHYQIEERLKYERQQKYLKEQLYWHRNQREQGWDHSQVRNATLAVLNYTQTVLATVMASIPVDVIEEGKFPRSTHTIRIFKEPVVAINKIFSLIVASTIMILLIILRTKIVCFLIFVLRLIWTRKEEVTPTPLKQDKMVQEVNINHYFKPSVETQPGVGSTLRDVAFDPSPTAVVCSQEAASNKDRLKTTLKEIPYSAHDDHSKFLECIGEPQEAAVSTLIQEITADIDMKEPITESKMPTVNLADYDDDYLERIMEVEEQLRLLLEETYLSEYTRMLEILPTPWLGPDPSPSELNDVAVQANISIEDFIKKQALRPKMKDQSVATPSDGYDARGFKILPNVNFPKKYKKYLSYIDAELAVYKVLFSDDLEEDDFFDPMENLPTIQEGKGKKNRKGVFMKPKKYKIQQILRGHSIQLQKFSVRSTQAGYVKSYKDENGQVVFELIDYEPSAFELAHLGQDLDLNVLDDIYDEVSDYIDDRYLDEHDPYEVRESVNWADDMDMRDLELAEFTNAVISVYDERVADRDDYNRIVREAHQRIMERRGVQEATPSRFILANSRVFREKALGQLIETYPRIGKIGTEGLVGAVQGKYIPLVEPIEHCGQQFRDLGKLLKFHMTTIPISKSVKVPIPDRAQEAVYTSSTYVPTVVGVAKVTEGKVSIVSEDHEPTPFTPKQYQRLPPVEQPFPQPAPSVRERLKKSWIQGVSMAVRNHSFKCALCNRLTTYFHYQDRSYCKHCVVNFPKECRACSWNANQIKQNYFHSRNWILPSQPTTQTQQHSLFCVSNRQLAWTEKKCQFCLDDIPDGLTCPECDQDQIFYSTTKSCCGINWNCYLIQPRRPDFRFEYPEDLCDEMTAPDGSVLHPQQCGKRTTDKRVNFIKANKEFFDNLGYTLPCTTSKCERKCGLSHEPITQEIVQKYEELIPKYPEMAKSPFASIFVKSSKRQVTFALPPSNRLEEALDRVNKTLASYKEAVTIYRRLEKEAGLPPRNLVNSRTMSAQEAVLLVDPPLAPDHAQVLITHGAQGSTYTLNASAITYSVNTYAQQTQIIGQFVTVAHYSTPDKPYFNIVEAEEINVAYPDGHPLYGLQPYDFHVEYGVESDMIATVYMLYRTDLPATTMFEELASRRLLAGRLPVTTDVTGKEAQVVTLGTHTMTRNVVRGKVLRKTDIEETAAIDLKVSVVDPDTSTGPGSSGSICYVKEGSKWYPYAVHFGSLDGHQTNTLYRIDNVTPKLPQKVKKWCS